MSDGPAPRSTATDSAARSDEGRLRRLRRGVASLWRRRHPSAPVRRGAGWGAAALVLLLAVLLGSRIQPGLGAVADMALGALAGLLFVALVGLGVLAGLGLLRDLPRFLGRLGVAALGALAFVLLFMDFPPPVALGFAAALALLEAVLGGGLAFLLGGGRRAAGRLKRTAAAVLIVAAVAGNVWILAWLAGEGSREHLVESPVEEVPVEPLALPDPSRPGPHRVVTVTYGSGDDPRRPEFGAAADLTTEPVDASPFVEGDEGWRMKLRNFYWGFDFERFPLNGRVWYPDGEGPFPLALIVHGNHNMAEFSDPGYAYLGELLASRGFILVSVDENFFNGSWIGGLSKENDGRGWLLLKHLEVWRGWNEEPGNPFHGKVDLDRIALMGHSRGGEAAAIAASFNRLARYPDDATVELPSGFGVRAVVAIAPSDGQYEPAGRPTPLADVDYLVLQGAHDADVSIYAGARQFQRLSFTDGGYRFKAGIYAYRANHGQFNTVWGRTDFSWPMSLFLNLEPLLPADEQRRLGEVYISAFLEASLRGNRDYLPLFRDPRRAAAWLPEDRYVSRFEDSTFRRLAGFEEDVDVTTATAPGTAVEAEGLAVWREEDLAWRSKGRSTQENQVVVLGWRRAEEAEVEAEGGAPGAGEGASGSGGGAEDAGGEAPAARYAIRLPSGLAADWGVGEGSLLVFSAADSGQGPPEPDAEEAEGDETEGDEDEEEDDDEEDDAEEDGEDEEEERQPLDFTVELETEDGVVARLPVSRFRHLAVPFESRFLKFPPDAEEEIYGDAWEVTLQTFEIPLAAFAAETPGFDPARLAAVRLVFDRTAEGVLVLDDVGFASTPPSPLAASGGPPGAPD